MEQKNSDGKFFRLTEIFKSNKYALECSVLFLGVITLVCMLILRNETSSLDFVVMYVCLISSYILHFHAYKFRLQEKYKNIILNFVLMLIIISGEILLIICGVNNLSLQYARFVHLAIRGMGVLASAICFMSLVTEKHRIQEMFNSSFAILTSSVCLFSLMHDSSFALSDGFGWRKYILLEGGVIVINALCSIHSLMWRRCQKV